MESRPIVIRSKKTGLVAPMEYWKIPPEDMHLHVSGRCGPGKGLGDKLVPETLWGLSVTPACEIHDFMYSFGEKTAEYKDIADKVFLSNMLTIIDKKTRYKALKYLRKKRAFKYYVAVSTFGDACFYDRGSHE